MVKDGLQELTLKLGEMTAEEREIMLKGCLINYNRVEVRDTKTAKQETVCFQEESRRFPVWADVTGCSGIQECMGALYLEGVYVDLFFKQIRMSSGSV